MKITRTAHLFLFAFFAVQIFAVEMVDHSADLDALRQGSLDVFKIIEPLCTEQINDQVRSSKSNAIALNKMIEPVIVRSGDDNRFPVLIFRLGGACLQVHPQLEEDIMVCHGALPNQQMRSRHAISEALL